VTGGMAAIEGHATIVRFDPARDRGPREEVHDFRFTAGMTVLDALLAVGERDPTISFSYCCRNSHCGVCGVEIDGRPGLLCREAALRETRLAPLAHLPLVRDLMVDRDPYGQRTVALRLFLERADAAPAEPEFVSREDHDRFKVASRCVECFCCLAACPVYGERPHDFLGPCGFALLGRHAFDPRDRLDRRLLAASGGASLCTRCGQCSDVCPHDVDPAGIVALLQDGAHGLGGGGSP
jgi:succinate dehydrogenase/fumarate reductase iron-sulfur protein